MNRYLGLFKKYQEESEKLDVNRERKLAEEEAIKTLYKHFEPLFTKEKQEISELLIKLETDRLLIDVCCADVQMDQQGIIHYRNFVIENDGKKYYESEKQIKTGSYSTLRDFVKIMKYDESIDDALGGGYGTTRLSESKLIEKSLNVLEKSAEMLIKKKLGLEARL